MIPLFKLGMYVLASQWLSSRPEFVFNNCPPAGEVLELTRVGDARNPFLYRVVFVCTSGNRTNVLSFEMAETEMVLDKADDPYHKWTK